MYSHGLFIHPHFGGSATLLCFRWYDKSNSWGVSDLMDSASIAKLDDRASWPTTWAAKELIRLFTDETTLSCCWLEPNWGCLKEVNWVRGFVVVDCEKEARLTGESRGNEVELAERSRAHSSRLWPCVDGAGWVQGEPETSVCLSSVDSVETSFPVLVAVVEAATDSPPSVVDDPDTVAWVVGTSNIVLGEGLGWSAGLDDEKPLSAVCLSTVCPISASNKINDC